MKVDVIQVDEASFCRFSWWSKWIDVAVYDFNCTPFLIQMKVSRFNKKKFRSERITGRVYRQASCSQIGDLTQMKRS